jgi:hypothetical protein
VNIFLNLLISPIIREIRFKLCERRILRTLFEPTKNDITAGSRKSNAHNGKHRDTQSLPYIIKAFKIN